MSNNCSDRMCGASDCARCTPGADRLIACADCGDSYEAWLAADHMVEHEGWHYCHKCADTNANDACYDALAWLEILADTGRIDNARTALLEALKRWSEPNENA